MASSHSTEELSHGNLNLSRRSLTTLRWLHHSGQISICEISIQSWPTNITTKEILVMQLYQTREGYTINVTQETLSILPYQMFRNLFSITRNGRFWKTPETVSSPRRWSVWSPGGMCHRIHTIPLHNHRYVNIHLKNSIFYISSQKWD